MFLKAAFALLYLANPRDRGFDGIDRLSENDKIAVSIHLHVVSDKPLMSRYGGISTVQRLTSLGLFIYQIR
ncbi:hypothetical protein Pla52o_48330 [Novipirellula galeiformis]|uniref:Uncharacterized protein n=1 Tax=Novipirellula galeiformis TaxID=2528004 RepID=A0A5C6CA88_9BACT|nr:hypothetical protein Pla52o_48330 [Novipirellula galeiformis]